MTCRVASTIQRVEAIDAVGPQYWKSGNSPSAPVELVVQGRRAHVGVGRLAPVGVVDRPRGDGDVGGRAHRVPPADVGRGEARVAARRAGSHTFSPCTSALCCRHRCTSPWSRKYQPLPTMPCWAGERPVSIVDCTLHVTAGSTVPSRAWAPDAARALRRGMCARARRVMPTTSRRRTEVMRAPPSAQGRALGPDAAWRRGVGARSRRGVGARCTAPASSASAAQRTSPAIPATRSSTPPGRTDQV